MKKVLLQAQRKLSPSLHFLLRTFYVAKAAASALRNWASLGVAYPFERRIQKVRLRCCWCCCCGYIFYRSGEKEKEREAFIHWPDLLDASGKVSLDVRVFDGSFFEKSQPRFQRARSLRGFDKIPRSMFYNVQWLVEVEGLFRINFLFIYFRFIFR